jgi:hypothetical protein
MQDRISHLRAKMALPRHFFDDVGPALVGDGCQIRVAMASIAVGQEKVMSPGEGICRHAGPAHRRRSHAVGGQGPRRWCHPRITARFHEADRAKGDSKHDSMEPPTRERPQRDLRPLEQRGWLHLEGPHLEQPTARMRIDPVRRQCLRRRRTLPAGKALRVALLVRRQASRIEVAQLRGAAQVVVEPSLTLTRQVFYSRHG